jgi:hypothetical protein
MWKLRTAHPSMRSLDIQRAVIGIALDDLNLELLKEWRLPSLLLRLADHHHANHAAVKNVLLAANLAQRTVGLIQRCTMTLKISPNYSTRLRLGLSIGFVVARIQTEFGRPSPAQPAVQPDCPTD